MLVLSEAGPQALQYSTTEGYTPLREMLVRHMARYGVKVEVDNTSSTSGSQQALDLIGKMLINPGDTILTEIIVPRRDSSLHCVSSAVRHRAY